MVVRKIGGRKRGASDDVLDVKMDSSVKANDTSSVCMYEWLDVFFNFTHLPPVDFRAVCFVRAI